VARIKSILVVVSGIVSIVALGCFFAFGQRPYLAVLAFLGVLVTLTFYAYSAPGGDTVAEDLRRADETPREDAPE
jgi:hypothetical protein